MEFVTAIHVSEISTLYFFMDEGVGGRVCSLFCEQRSHIGRTCGQCPSYSSTVYGRTSLERTRAEAPYAFGPPYGSSSWQITLYVVLEWQSERCQGQYIPWLLTFQNLTFQNQSRKFRLSTLLASFKLEAHPTSRICDVLHKVQTLTPFTVQYALYSINNRAISAESVASNFAKPRGPQP